jgi:dephospho-CoA kinase
MKSTLTVNREVSVVKIALCGKLRSGKSEVGNYLHIHHGFDEVAFGTELKRNYHAVLPWVPEFPKPRKGYQDYGQKMREICGDDIWIKHAERKINGIIDFRVNTNADKIGIVITDLRQENEAEWCRKNGFTLIRVTAPDEVRIGRAIEAGDDFTVHDLCHGTELEIDNFAVDYEVNNEGTVDDLKRKIDEILEAIN